jgi:hypothetical protein
VRLVWIYSPVKAVANGGVLINCARTGKEWSSPVTIVGSKLNIYPASGSSKVKRKITYYAIP